METLVEPSRGAVEVLPTLISKTGCPSPGKRHDLLWTLLRRAER